VCFDDESYFVWGEENQNFDIKKLLPRRMLTSHLSKYAIKYILSTHRKDVCKSNIKWEGNSFKYQLDSVSIWEGRGNLNKKRETLAHF